MLYNSVSIAVLLNEVFQFVKDIQPLASLFAYVIDVSRTREKVRSVCFLDNLRELFVSLTFDFKITLI